MTELAAVVDPQVGLAQTPAQIIDFATDAANRLKDIVEKQDLFVTISGKKHLNAEAWMTIIALDNAHPIIEWTKPIEENGKVIGYWARAAIMKNGEIISTGEMPCGFDDFSAVGKTGIAQHRACVSTAETWAIAKAGRGKYAWIVTMAGYAPTPSHEMIQDKPAPAQTSQKRPQSDQHPWLINCPEHNADWFQTEKMRSAAHRTEDGGWCNQPGIIAQHAGDVVAAAVGALEWDRKRAAEWLRTEYGGAWSKLSPADHISAMGALGALARAAVSEDKPDDPDGPTDEQAAEMDDQVTADLFGSDEETGR